NSSFHAPTLEMDGWGSAIGRPQRRQSERARDSTRNRARPSALRLPLDFSGVFRRQRTLRHSRTRDFKSSASGMEVSVGIQKHNSTGAACKGTKHGLYPYDPQFRSRILT